MSKSTIAKVTKYVTNGREFDSAKEAKFFETALQLQSHFKLSVGVSGEVGSFHPAVSDEQALEFAFISARLGAKAPAAKRRGPKALAAPRARRAAQDAAPAPVGEQPTEAAAPAAEPKKRRGPKPGSKRTPKVAAPSAAVPPPPPIN